ncbi:bifunctional metallophosphatase/5'-nucleotidase [Marinomonas dokdonensis]|uniref:bifunctional metallophosphatase/5'-nucleotidase n=1 Tax=Marinomonas dokdonensis TaxID=328224 RepID=UPI00405552C2
MNETRSLANLGGFIQNKRAQSPSFFIHGGDSLFPNALSVYDSGAHMIDVLNTIQTDVFLVNQREMAKGLDQLTLRTNEAEFPLVLSNVFDQRTSANIDGILPYYTLPTPIGDVGFLMLMSETVNSTYLTEDVLILNPIERAEAFISEMRSQGISHFVVVTEPDLLKLYPAELFTFADILFVASEIREEVHQHDDLLEVWGGGSSGNVAVVEWLPDSKRAHFESYAGAEIMPETEQMIQRYVSHLGVVLEQPLGILVAPMDSMRNNIRTQESALGNLFADALRSATKTDFAVLNSGAIRGNRQYRQGEQISRKDIQNELPFGGVVHKVKVFPIELKAIMEHSLSDVANKAGRFLQVSGFEVGYDLSRPVGKRVLTLTSGGRPLVNREYWLAIPDYIKNGGDDYVIDASKVAREMSNQDRFVWNIVADYLALVEVLAPRLEGRLREQTVKTEMAQ